MYGVPNSSLIQRRQMICDLERGQAVNKEYERVRKLFHKPHNSYWLREDGKKPNILNALGYTQCISLFYGFSEWSKGPAIEHRTSDSMNLAFPRTRWNRSFLPWSGLISMLFHWLIIISVIPKIPYLAISFLPTQRIVCLISQSCLYLSCLVQIEA